LPFGDIPFEPFGYVFLPLRPKLAKRDNDTFNRFKLQPSKKQRFREYRSYELEVPEPSKTYSYIISARSGYSSVFGSKDAMDLAQERVQCIVEKKCRARAPLHYSRQKFNNSISSATMEKSGRSITVDSLKKLDVMAGELSDFEDKPNPAVNH